MGTGNPSRREFLARAGRGAGAAVVAGGLWAWIAGQQVDASALTLRPPGALAEREFLASCIKCGLCVADCPYDTLRLAEAGSRVPLGTPYFEPRDVPCFMCPDIPCVAACPTAALDSSLADVARSRMGLAVLIDQEHCLSYRGLRCEICYRDCPLQNEAISVEKRPRELSKHAMFIPVVRSESCTGCGICEKSCPLPEPAIKVLPREIAQGAPGEHYELGWIEPTELTREFQPAEAPPADTVGDVEAGLDYLNEGAP